MGPRRRNTLLGLVMIILIATVVNIISIHSDFPNETTMKQKLAELHMHFQFLESLYRSRQEDLLILQAKTFAGKTNVTTNKIFGTQPTKLTPETENLLESMKGSHAASGFSPVRLQALRMPLVISLLPHLLEDPFSLRPAYHMKGKRNFVEIVIGIPTVKRNKENYLMITLTHLINGISKENMADILIVILIGETDQEYVLKTAQQIEAHFPEPVKMGMIEVLSPTPSFYPDIDCMEPTLGDSKKRFKWRTKQNLDTIYLMSYAQPKGSYYLMLEDDIVAKHNYLTEIKRFTTEVTSTNPNWVILEFCRVGGIGKLFKSSSLTGFVTYLQLFYRNMPVDWLIESYLADRVCSIDKTSKQCGKSKLSIRPKYAKSLFQHIGLFSSLEGKIQKLKDPQFGSIPLYYPHKNPPLASLRNDITEFSKHTLLKAYKGVTFFWGIKPKKDSIIEFTFKYPTVIKRFLFRSGNMEHVSDKFYNTIVLIAPYKTGNASFEQVAAFDEFGIAIGKIKSSFGPLSAIRIKVEQESKNWVILSEIELVT